MTTRSADERTTWARWLICGLVVGLCLLGFVAAALAEAPTLADRLNRVVTNLIWLLFGSVGALIVLRRPHNAIGWLLMIPGISGAANVPVQWAVNGLVAAAPTSLALLGLAWFSGMGWWLLIGPLLLIILLFPTGRLLSPRWRWVVILLGLVFVYFACLGTLARVYSFEDPPLSFNNPFGLLSDDELATLLIPMQVGLTICTVLSVASMVLRYRRALAVERAQIRWLLYACALFGLVYPLSLFHSDSAWAGVLFGLLLLAVPIAIAVAVLRYRLWDIDVIIRRTLVYSVLTGGLALAYFGSVVVLQNLLHALSGQGQNPIVTVGSTLIIAALFVPLRGRVQVFIDRRFYRQKYNAARTLADYGARLRDETDLDRVSEHLLDAVEGTMQPQSVSLWMAAPRRPGKRNNL